MSARTPLVVLNNPGEQTRALLRDELSRVAQGVVRLSHHDRMLYATDASMYQVEPLGVVVPADADDVVRVVEWCDANDIAMLPRGGGTSLAGQCVNEALVIDTSATMRGIRNISVDSGGGLCYAEAGAVLDEINHELARRKTGLFFPPDPATVAQACVGGCIGNNAAGSRSIKYGRMVDSVLSIDAVTASGHRFTLGPNAGSRDPIALKLADGVINVVRRHERLIRERYPKTLRRNAGYALDMILAQLDKGADAHTLDLTKLLCGSEGTLAITLGATLRLWPTPKAKGLALVSFASVDEAIAAVVPILTTGVSATELVDDVVIEAALNNIECRRYVEAFPRVNGESPRGVLYVEYHEPSEQALREKLARLRAVIGTAPIREVLDAPGMADAWKLRKAGEPLLHGLPGHRKPLTFVEDNAVPPERLGEFVREFRKIVEREGTRAAFWAHASVGVLHVRPMIDPHDEADLERLQRIAVEVADLAKRCGGVMSGEHGDGRVRGPLLERFYGPELMHAFREVKSLFDPKGLLNPGNIVAPGPIPSIVERTRIDPTRHTLLGTPTVPAGSSSSSSDQKTDPAGTAGVPKDISTYYTYDDHHGFDGAVERCNGAGVCRKQSGGTMCPSYRGTNDERHSTRGRGNALRLAITGQLGTPGTPAWDDPETMKTLDLCLGCKACKSECPSNVDIARLKAEYAAQRYRATGKVPLKVTLAGHVRRLNALGAITPTISNWFNTTRLGRAVINRVMGIHPSRTLPAFSPSLFARWNSIRVEGRMPADAPRVVLFSDCFVTYNDSHIGLAAKRVLSALGYRVELPNAGCCGRAMISMGLLPQAIETIDATLAKLKPIIDDNNVKAILVAEPSCLSAIKDDWLQLRCTTPLPLRQKLAAKAMLIEDFLDRAWDTHPNQSTVKSLVSRGKDFSNTVALHAHCQQKALWGINSSAAVLRRVLGDKLKSLDTGCCGMCGAFGYDADKYDLSMRIANLPAHAGGVMKSIETAGVTTVVAPGTSCRHQIHDASEGQHHAVHPVVLLDRLLHG